MITEYIYNKVKASLRTALFLSFGAVLFTGCSNFLDIEPMNSTDWSILRNTKTLITTSMRC